LGQNGGEPILFMGESLANRILHEGVTGSHNTLFSQVMHEFPEDINGFYRNGCRLIVRKMRSPIQGLDFVIPQDSQPFLCRVGRLIFQGPASP
jgi:hypothetical protein